MHGWLAQVLSFRRTILSFRVEPCSSSIAGRDVTVLHLRGTAFLWHQVPPAPRPVVNMAPSWVWRLTCYTDRTLWAASPWSSGVATVWA